MADKKSNQQQIIQDVLDEASQSLKVTVSGATAGLDTDVGAPTNNTLRTVISTRSEDPTTPIAVRLADGSGFYIAGSSFTRNGIATTATLDTVTPSNNRPSPVVQLAGDSLGPISMGTGSTTATTQRITLGTDQFSDIQQQTTYLQNISARTPAYGQDFMANSVPVVIASNQSPIPVTQSGTWNINNISGTISLPTDAATETTLSTINTKIITVDTDNVAVVSSVLPTNAATDSNQVTGNNLLTSIDNKILTNFNGSTTNAIRTAAILGNSSGEIAYGSGTINSSTPRVNLATNQSPIPVTQSGTWSVSGSGRSMVLTFRRDYSSSSVTTGAWIQITASTAATINRLQIFDSSGQTLELGTGAAASETRLFLIPPGGIDIDVAITSGTRLSLRAVSATADAGEIDINALS